MTPLCPRTLHAVSGPDEHGARFEIAGAPCIGSRCAGWSPNLDPAMGACGLAAGGVEYADPNEPEVDDGTVTPAKIADSVVMR